MFILYSLEVSLFQRKDKSKIGILLSYVSHRLYTLIVK